MSAKHFKWREAGAKANMHAQMAQRKLQLLIMKDGAYPLIEQLNHMSKLIESLEEAHAAAIEMYDEYCEQMREKHRHKGLQLVKHERVTVTVPATSSSLQQLVKQNRELLARESEL